MNIRKLSNVPMSAGRVSHTVIPRSDAESSKQLGVLDSASERNDNMRDTPLIEYTTWRLADIQLSFADDRVCCRRKFFVFICFVMLAESWCFIVHAVRYFGGVFFLIHPKTC